jgi:hypothetical protein
MENNIIKDFIHSKLDLYDKSNEKYEHLITNKNIIFDPEKLVITFYDDNKKTNVVYRSTFSILGMFDLNTNMWLWAWVTPNLSINECKHARDILNYGLLLEPKSNETMHYYIKSHLINSRLYFADDITLDIHLALAFYLSKIGKFVYPYTKIINDKNTNIVSYYLIY